MRRHYRHCHGERQQGGVEQLGMGAAHHPGEQQVRRPEPGGHHFFLFIRHEDGIIHPGQGHRAQGKKRQPGGVYPQFEIMPEAQVFPPQRDQAGGYRGHSEEVPGQVYYHAPQQPLYKLVAAERAGQAGYYKRDQRQGVKPEEAVGEETEAHYYAESERPVGMFKIVGADKAGVKGGGHGQEGQFRGRAARGLKHKRERQGESGAQPACAVGAAFAHGRENSQGEDEEEKRIDRHQGEVEVLGEIFKHRDISQVIERRVKRKVGEFRLYQRPEALGLQIGREAEHAVKAFSVSLGEEIAAPESPLRKQHGVEKPDPGQDQQPGGEFLPFRLHQLFLEEDAFKSHPGSQEFFAPG